jgi:methylthioribose-1-phosphate isomerase
MSDGPGRPPEERRPDAAQELDPARRRFFKDFSKEVVTSAATVMNMAGSLQRTSAQAAAAILDPVGGAALLGGLLPETAAPAPAAPTGFRAAFRWSGERLVLVDQRKLPHALEEFEVTSASDAAFAIREMIVRGAPAIGQVAAIGLALTANRLRTAGPFARKAAISGAANGLAATRPTAVNLRWAMDRMLVRLREVGEYNEDGNAVADALWDEAGRIVGEATEDHGRLATLGAEVLPPIVGRPLQLLTHCNTGPLACGQFGTALGVVQVAFHGGRDLHVWVDETRPYLQGARLTAWELAQAGVPHTLVADVAAASLLAAGRVDAVLVGADRVAANGDTANKLGTYPLALAAAHHGVPFIVCAPLSSIDRAMLDGASIPIEQRSPDEVLRFRGALVAPEGTEAWNPAFDVTPAGLISAIVTEEGVLRPPFGPAIVEAFERASARRPDRVTVGGAGEPAPDPTEPAPDRTEPAPDRTEPAPDRTEPAPDRTEPAPDRTEPAPDRTEPAPDRTEPAPDPTAGALDTAG